MTMRKLVEFVIIFTFRYRLEAFNDYGETGRILNYLRYPLGRDKIKNLIPALNVRAGILHDRTPDCYRIAWAYI